MKIFNCTWATLVSLMLSVSATAFGQTSLTYDQLTSVIHALKTSNTYGPNTAVLVHEIIQNMIGEASYSPYSSSALKKHLLNDMTWDHLNQIAAHSYPNEASILKLMLATYQAPVDIFITDDDLANAFGSNGQELKSEEENLWNSMPVNALANSSWLRVFEAYSPYVASSIAELIVEPCIDSSGVDDVPVSWASQSLWQIFHDMRMYELSKRSVALRLLGRFGIIQIPNYAYAEFTWSGMSTRTMDLRYYHWTSADIPTLRRLRTNPYYGTLAKATLPSIH